ncbi:hypothetical protein BCR41DRAFT_372735 [Lobosporangium transversale]|uniref:Uncharacterized protein n=1 Tax=Lobosporangium transversale TaxID=64571 RepID=A0A1Y2GFX3_9FUNG|nr:hypothetical protein BCR41DRAFT_372735 [Lobosporangium transversale]ORZ09708.1 hypothetical protein BCR41DRAFT_372735 [Lobosporangium transversale]|eukprot:XP_021878978.1 hypothetical protein BCR41DRAFT_372735 [Lobosporangium transversale]
MNNIHMLAIAYFRSLTDLHKYVTFILVFLCSQLPHRMACHDMFERPRAMLEIRKRQLQNLKGGGRNEPYLISIFEPLVAVTTALSISFFPFFLSLVSLRIYLFVCCIFSACIETSVSVIDTETQGSGDRRKEEEDPSRRVLVLQAITQKKQQRYDNDYENNGDSSEVGDNIGNMSNGIKFANEIKVQLYQNCTAVPEF